MRFGIVVATYMRKDGSTPNYLTRALDSIFNQTYKNFKIFLIGDKYENENEIIDIIKKYDQTRLHFTNLPYAKERDNYTDKSLLWSYGGVNAINFGVDLSLKENLNYVCHLDHDDWWEIDHLQEIYNCLRLHRTNFICTKSTFKNANRHLPINLPHNMKYVNFMPLSSGLIHSSVCMNFKEIPLRYRDVFLEEKKLGLPADADLWERVRFFMRNNNQTGICINKLTCNHIEEGYSKL